MIILYYVGIRVMVLGPPSRTKLFLPCTAIWHSVIDLLYSRSKSAAQSRPHLSTCMTPTQAHYWQKRKSLNKLEYAAHSHFVRKFCFILGDFNAKSEPKTPLTTVFGLYSRGCCNNNGVRLRINILYLCNTTSNKRAWKR